MVVTDNGGATPAVVATRSASSSRWLCSRRAEAWGGGDFGAEERCARGGRGKPAMHGDEERGEAMCSR